MCLHFSNNISKNLIIQNNKMTNYHWIYYNKENINELYEQDEKITQQELMNEKQQEQMKQTKTRAQ